MSSSEVMKVVSGITLAIFILGIPVLFSVSICFNWWGITIALLGALTVFDIIFLSWFLVYKAFYDDDE